MAGLMADLRFFGGALNARAMPAPKAVIMATVTAIFAGAAAFAGGNTLMLPAASTIGGATASFSERFSFTPEDCSTKSWPYLGADCLRMADGTRARPVRTIAIDR